MGKKSLSLLQNTPHISVKSFAKWGDVYTCFPFSGLCNRKKMFSKLSDQWNCQGWLLNALIIDILSQGGMLLPVRADWVTGLGLFLCSSLFDKAVVGEPREEEHLWDLGVFGKTFAAERDCLSWCHWVGSGQGRMPLRGSLVCFGISNPGMPQASMILVGEKQKASLGHHCRKNKRRTLGRVREDKNVPQRLGCTSSDYLLRK